MVSLVPLTNHRGASLRPRGMVSPSKTRMGVQKAAREKYHSLWMMTSYDGTNKRGRRGHRTSGAQSLLRTSSMRGTGSWPRLLLLFNIL